MSDLSVTILPETPEDALAIERLHERTFGPGRYARTAYRIREQFAHRCDLSFTARIGTLLVGSVRSTPICIGGAGALLLGPLPCRGGGSAFSGWLRCAGVSREEQAPEPVDRVVVERW